MSTLAKDFADTSARYGSANGGSEIRGRIVGRLMLDENNGVSAAQLAEELAISRGSVSTAVRQLEQAGFIRRTRHPSNRADWLIMDDDVWAGFLEQEYNYLAAQRDLAAAVLAVLPAESPARQRVRNMHDYMSWLTADLDLRSDWQEHKRELASRRREG